MRRGLVVLLLILFLPFPVAAQSAPELGTPIRVLDDPTGDYYASLRDGPGITDPIDYYTFMDMDWLDVTESQEGFTFTLKVVDIEGPLDDASFSDGGYFWIHFRHNDWDYRLEIERPSGQTEISYRAVLYSKYQDADEWGFLWRDLAGVSWSIPDATITYSVDRNELSDSRGAAPYPGRSLTEFWVSATQRSSSAESDFRGQDVRFPWQLQDRMPDTGVGEVAVPVRAGLQQSGSAFLRSDEPYRASNGEATTFLFTVLASNMGSSKQLFQIEATETPPTWTVEFPLAGFELAPDETLAVPVLVTTPFSHSHDGTQSFVVKMQSTSEPNSVGSVELGVRYLATPQPAGHHSQVILHSLANTQTASFNSAFEAAFQPSGNMYFNTLSEDPSSDGVPVSAFTNFDSGVFTWLIPLDPTLRMGLDFDLERMGLTSFEINSPGPLQEAEMTGAFVLRQAGSDLQSISDAEQLATFSAPARTWNAGATESFEVDITPQEAGDYIEYSASNELWLVIELTNGGVSTYNQNSVPKINAGGTFTLPLLEYEDDISDAFNALSGARMVPLTAATRDANPGDVILFNVAVSAHQGAAGQYGIHLTGMGSEWATIVTDSPIPVGADATTSTVMVQIPLDAEDGDRADMFLHASHITESQRRGLIRLVVNVDTDLEHADDSEAAALYLDADGKESAVPLLPSIVALAGAALIARRRLH